MRTRYGNQNADKTIAMSQTNPKRKMTMRTLFLSVLVAIAFIPGICQAADAPGAEQQWAARRAKLDERPKKIFAHYMGCFPVGNGGVSPVYVRSNLPGIRHDSPNFEPAFGGRVRSEPLLPDGVDSLSLEVSADLEVRRAMRAGIDGFAFMAICGGANAFLVMDAMFKVCEEKDYPFEITWALSGLDRSVEAIDYILKKHGNSPKLARRDGKVLMLGYQSVFSGIEGAREIFSKRYPDIKVDSPEERCSPEFLRLLREGFRTKLEERFQTPMYFQFGFGALHHGTQGKPKEERPWPEIIGYLAEGFEAINAFHYSSGPTDYDAVAKAVTDKGAEWGEPMMYCYENLLWQGYRPRSFPLEPGSDAIRHCWENARRNQSTLIQFTTWNDYCEATSLAPTTHTRYGMMDLNAYFVTWWKTGQEPRPEHDKIYLIYPQYRHELSVYPFGNRKAWRDTDAEAMNKLEVLTILTAPATVRLPGTDISWEAPAGLSYKQLPLKAGTTRVEVLRDSKVAAKLDNSADPVTDLPYREQHSMVCVSSEDLRHWKADFGDAPPAPIQRGEYGDLDGDGLPNWFEMYWFGKSLADWPSAAAADPKADPDGDGKSNLEEYLAQSEPTKAASYTAGYQWDFMKTLGARRRSFNPDVDEFGTPVWHYLHKYSMELPIAHDGNYWACERYNWTPGDAVRSCVFGAWYNTPTPHARLGQFRHEWRTEGAGEAKSESYRFTLLTGLNCLRVLAWESPVSGRVKFSWATDGANLKDNENNPVIVTLEHSRPQRELARWEFTPRQGGEGTVEGIEVQPGDRLYLVATVPPPHADHALLTFSTLNVELQNDGKDGAR